MLRCAERSGSKHSRSTCEKSKPQSRRYGMRIWILSNPEILGDFIDELYLIFCPDSCVEVKFTDNSIIDHKQMVHFFNVFEVDARFQNPGFKQVFV